MQVPTDCFDLEKESTFQKLRETAIKESCCGQNAVIERKDILSPASEVTIYATVTNIVRYDKATKPSEPDALSNGSVKRRTEKGIETSRKRPKGHKRKSAS